MRQKKIVMFHAISKTIHCNDGFASAFCAWAKFRDSAAYIPYYHGGELPELETFKDKQVYFLDFAPDDVAVTDAIRAVTESFVILDHHKTSIELYRGKDYFCPTSTACSQAAWEMFHDGTLPIMLEHIADNDLWLHRNPNTKAFIQRLSDYPYRFKAWEYLLNRTESDQEYYRRFIEEGNILLEHARQHVSIIAESAMQVAISGVPGLAVNYQGPSFYVSSIGEELAKRSGTFGAAFVYSDRNTVTFELRAAGNTNVATLAKTMGGGGHENSAGFRATPEQLSTILGSAVQKVVDFATLKLDLEKIADEDMYTVAGVYRKLYETCAAHGVTPQSVLVRHSMFSPLLKFFMRAPLKYSAQVRLIVADSAAYVSVSNTRQRWFFTF